MSNADKNIEITFINEGTGKAIVAHADKGELLTQVAHRAGIVIQQTCGGSPSCTDCKVIVKENYENAFVAPKGAELRLLGNVYHITKERLACQAFANDSSTILVPDPKAIKKKADERNQRWLDDKRKQVHQRQPQKKKAK